MKPARPCPCFWTDQLPAALSKFVLVVKGLKQKSQTVVSRKSALLEQGQCRVDLFGTGSMKTETIVQGLFTQVF